MPATKSDHFLAEAVKSKPSDRRLAYADGFRFGFGFFIAGLLITVVLGGLTWGGYMLMHLH